ncbi:MAG: carbohydrate kinase family protein, partial [Ardenticatenaceae bacterium]
MGGTAIAVIGDAVVDLVALGLEALPTWGEDREVGAIERRLGGSGMHVATNLAALGNEVSLLAGVGMDAWGEFLLEGARAAGVDVRAVRRLPVPSAVTIVLSGNRDRAFVSSYGA